MLGIQLLILLLLIFAGLIFFLRQILIRNITKATGHLQELSKDFTSKQEETNRLLKEAKEEAEQIIVKEKQEAEEARNNVLKEAHVSKDKIISDARLKSEEMIEKAEKNCELMQRELDQRIESQAKEKACRLIQHSLPENFLKEYHDHIMKGADKNEIHLERLKLPENIKEVKIVSAFSLTEKQCDDLKKSLKKRLNGNIKFDEETDSALIAGFIVTLGSVVVDASLRYKIQKAAENV
jgi:F0F1-type ATP synthase delta subunit